MKKFELTPRIAAWLAFLIPMVVFFPVVFNNFVNWDDNLHLTDNPFMKTDAFSDFFHFWKESYGGLYIPITYNFWQLTRLLGNLIFDQENLVCLHHALSLLLHALNSFLVFLVARRMNGSPWHALLASLFFSLFPSQVESVAWVSESKGLLAAFFGILSLLFQFSASECGARWNRNLLFAFLLQFVAILAKPSAVVFPVIGFLLLYFKNRKVYYPLVITQVFMTCLVVPVVWLSTQAQANSGQVDFIPELWERPVIALDAIRFYLEKLLLPFDFGIDYGRRPQVILASTTLVWSSALPAFLFAVLLVFRKKAEGLFVSFAVMVVAMLPNLGLVCFVFQDYSTVADRYFYIPALGVAVGIVLVLKKNTSALSVSFLLLYLTICGIVSWKQISVWNNSISLATKSIYVNPESAVARGIRASAAREKKAFSLALSDINFAIRFDPGNSRYWLDKASILKDMGELDSAALYCRKVMTVDPKNTTANLLLADILFRRNQYRETERIYAKIYGRVTGYEKMLICISRAKIAVFVRNFQKAKKELDKVLPFLESDWRIPLQAGDVYLDIGEYEIALSMAEIVLDKYPMHVMAALQKARAYRRLGWFKKLDRWTKILKEKGIVLPEEIRGEQMDKIQKITWKKSI